MGTKGWKGIDEYWRGTTTCLLVRCNKHNNLRLKNPVAGGTPIGGRQRVIIAFPIRVNSALKRRPPTARHLLFCGIYPCLWFTYTTWPTLANAPLVAGYHRYPPRLLFFDRSDCASLGSVFLASPESQIITTADKHPRPFVFDIFAELPTPLRWCALNKQTLAENHPD
jgi:hypothetical protein